jgi:hypothetical protein
MVGDSATDHGSARQGVARSPDNPAARSRWFHQSRLGSTGAIRRNLIFAGSRLRRLSERQRLARLHAETAVIAAAPGVNWTPLGPSVVTQGQPFDKTSVSGRITALAVGPGARRVYAGAANGGVWFSGNGGANWAPLDDYSVTPGIPSGLEADSLSVGALAVRFGATAATDVIFVGTGEPQPGNINPSQEVPFYGDGYFGIGIKMSAAGGAPGTWSLEARNLAGLAIFRIVIDPDDSTIVLAATNRGIYQRPATAPFTNWGQRTAGLSSPGAAVSDLVIAGRGPNKQYYAAFWGEKVYRSRDTVDWSPVAGIELDSPPPGPGRIALAAGEGSESVVYGLSSDGRLYRLDRGTADAFQPVMNAPPPAALFRGGQGDYDVVLGVAPDDANVVYLGGDLTWEGGLPVGTGNGDWSLSLYRDTVEGGPGGYRLHFDPSNVDNPQADPTWIGSGVHADIHAWAFATNLDGKSANIFSIAPGATFIGVKLENDGDPGAGASILEGVQEALRHQPHVISVSMGYDLREADQRTPLSQLPGSLKALEAEIHAAVDAGIVVVFSAGNGHYSFPGQMPDVISAGGVFVDANDSMQASDYASAFTSLIYSGRSVPDCCGLVGMLPNADYIMLPVPPSEEIDRENSAHDGTAPDDGWAVFSGTSAAAPQLAAVVRALAAEESRSEACRHEGYSHAHRPRGHAGAR